MSLYRETDQHKGSHWRLSCTDDDLKKKEWSNDHIKITLLADIRDTLVEIRTELRMLNATFRCPRVQAGFAALRSIARTDAGRLRDARAREKRRAKK